MAGCADPQALVENHEWLSQGRNDVLGVGQDVVWLRCRFVGVHCRFSVRLLPPRKLIFRCKGVLVRLIVSEDPKARHLSRWPVGFWFGGQFFFEGTVLPFCLRDIEALQFCRHVYQRLRLRWLAVATLPSTNSLRSHQPVEWERKKVAFVQIAASCFDTQRYSDAAGISDSPPDSVPGLVRQRVPQGSFR